MARAVAGAAPTLTVAEISTDPLNPVRPWRRTARLGLYRGHLAVDDLRSAERAVEAGAGALSAPALLLDGRHAVPW